MRHTHKYLPRDFRIPFGPFVIPVLGALFCILLMINVTRGTGIRYGVWMAIGHIVYFSYGFWCSRAHRERLQQARSSLQDLAKSSNVYAIELDEQQSTSSSIKQPIEIQF
jgi:basic amino acid/polyamine antiporter, APA family